MDETTVKKPKGICKVDGCNEPTYRCKGKTSKYCFTHYHDRRHKLEQYDHVCDNCGKIYTNRSRKSTLCTKCQNMYSKARSWYLQTTGKTQRVLVAEADCPLSRMIFCKHVGRPIQNGCDIHHIDGNKSNNALDNLCELKSADHAKYHAYERNRCLEMFMKVRFTEDPIPNPKTFRRQVFQDFIREYNIKCVIASDINSKLPKGWKYSNSEKTEEIAQAAP